MKRGLTILLLLLLPALGSAQNVLNDGDRLRAGLPDVGSGNLSIVFFQFDVPDDARSFSIGLTDLDTNDRNVDMLLRADQPFPTQISSFSELEDAANYAGQSPTPDDLIVVQDFVQPPAPGRQWHMALIIFEGTGGELGISLDYSSDGPPAATFVVDFGNAEGDPDCQTAPWNDSTTFTPVGGNQATTLGQARRNALLEGLRLVSQELTTPVPIRVLACFNSLGGDANSAVVANGRPTAGALNQPGMTKQDVLYAKSAVERFAGTDLCGLFDQFTCDEGDIKIIFNVDIDNQTVLGSTDWYYGFSPGATNDVDFVQVAVHEITHGLGYRTDSRELNNGNLPMAGSTVVSDAYLEYLVDTSSGSPVPLTELSSSQLSAAVKSPGNLQWNGPESAISLANDLALAGNGFIRMHAPATFEPGSSVTHLAVDPYCDLMLPVGKLDCGPFRSLSGLPKTMLNQLGWASGPLTPPYLGQMLDRSRNGHGFEFQLGGFLEGGTPLYVLTFYSYEDSSFPEWFQAVGVVEDGVFYGDGFRSGVNGLNEFTYDDSRNPPQQADPNHRGQVVLSFNDAAGSTACSDGVQRGDAAILYAMQWIVDDQIDEWCVEPLTLSLPIGNNDFGGLWFNDNDVGWGFSIENIDNGNGTTSLFVLVFVYAADGSPVWYFGFDPDFRFNQAVTMDLIQRNGFSRLELFDPDLLVDTVAGSLTLTLTTPSANLNAGNRVSIDVTYTGAEGGRWLRNDIPIRRLTQPRN